MEINLLRIFLFGIVVSAAFAATPAVATLPIDGELDIPNGDSATNIMVTLNGGEYSVLSRMDGRFTFHDIPSGIYLLDVLSINQVFSQMKIKVKAEEESIDVVEFKYPGAMRMQAGKLNWFLRSFLCCDFKQFIFDIIQPTIVIESLLHTFTEKLSDLIDFFEDDVTDSQSS